TAIEEELASLPGYTTASRAELLAITYRQLAINHAENQRYKDASRCRYQAMELGRQDMDPIWQEWYDFAPWRLDWWYWATSGYGERVIRATIFLVAIWIVFALLYTQVGFGRPIVDPQGQTDVGGEPLRGRAFVYSFEVMSLQKPEPRPLTTVAHILVGLETILGPAQAALLVLAIRLKFMR